MTELALRTNEDLTEKMEWSKAMAVSSLIPQQYRGNPANLLFAIEYADSLGIERINALTSIHVIEGKPSASAELIAGLIRRAGHRLRVTGDDKSATAELIRADDPDFTYTATWTIARAQTAGLIGKSVWKNYPAAMLRARVVTEVGRMGASDALLGVVYTPEELGADVDSQGQPVKPTRIQATVSGGAERMSTILGVAKEEAVDVEEVSEIAEEVELDSWGFPKTKNVSELAEVVDENKEVASDKQLKMIWAIQKKLGMTDPEVALNFINSCLTERFVTSSKELDRFQASMVIKELQAEEAKSAQ